MQEKKYLAAVNGRKAKNLVIPKRRELKKTKDSVENLAKKIDEKKINAAFEEKFKTWQKR